MIRRVHIAPGRLKQGGTAFFLRLIAKRLNFILGGETLISLAIRQHFMGDLCVTGGALKLADSLTIIIQSQPFHPAQDRSMCFGGGAFAVSVFNAQQELPATTPGIKPVKQGSARTSDMQIPRRRRGETGDNRAIRRSGVHNALTFLALTCC